MKRLRLVLPLALLLALTTGSIVDASSGPEFTLGFKSLADQIPDVVGLPLENEHYAANGDSVQRTTTGLMVWRSLDNWTAFTDGNRTWINGPYGIQDRANDERFDWEPVPPADPSADFPPPRALRVSYGSTTSQGSNTSGGFSTAGPSVTRQLQVANLSDYWTADLYLKEVRVYPSPTDPGGVTTSDKRTIVPSSIKPGEIATYQQSVSRAEHLESMLKSSSWVYVLRFVWSSPDRKRISLPQEQVIEVGTSLRPAQ